MEAWQKLIHELVDIWIEVDFKIEVLSAEEKKLETTNLEVENETNREKAA